MSSKSVLIVEDEVLVALVVEDLLADEGFSVIGLCRSGHATLAHLRRETPDILLLDVFLQDELSGIEVARIARQFWSGPIVFHTSAADPELREQMAAISNAIVLFKPTAKSELVRAIRGVLAD